MHPSLRLDKPTRLLIFLTSFFVANALIAECIGVKLFSLERFIGRAPQPFTLFGASGLTYTLTCGVVLWPLEFVMTDIVNEYYGTRVVRRISYTAVVLIGYAFLAFLTAINLPADDAFWRASNVERGVPDMQNAFSAIFGQGMWIIVGSLVAFLVSQLLDAYIFQRLKRATRGRYIWLRATGSTLVSQLVDSFIVLGIAFGGTWGWQRVLAVGIVNYSYKALAALALTPVIYLVSNRIDKYVGKEKAASMKRAALESSKDTSERLIGGSSAD